MIFGISGTKRTVCNREVLIIDVSVRRGSTVLGETTTIRRLCLSDKVKTKYIKEPDSPTLVDTLSCCRCCARRTQIHAVL